MVDLTITAASVAAQGGAGINSGTAAASITAGDALAKNSSGALVLASDASATLAAVCGIALHAAASGQPIKYQTSGRINLGATLAVGKHYVLSTDGGIAPVDDIAGGEFASYIGWAEDATYLRLGLLPADAAAAGAVA